MRAIKRYLLKLLVGALIGAVVGALIGGILVGFGWGASDHEIREREAIYDGWWRCETLKDIEEERLVESYAERNPGTVDRSDAAIAREMLKLVRRSVGRYGKPW